MAKRIILWHSERTLSTDDAGLSGNYSPEPLHHVPPLSYFCIKRLVEATEQIHRYGPPRPYRSPASPNDPDILRALIPYINRQGHFDLSKVDPRLWAVVVQVYTDLPNNLRTYRTALSDKYIDSLQRIPATEHFSLLTVLELPGCYHLDDNTIIHLSTLRTLCALDVSCSALSAKEYDGSLGP
ncbi:hypothetical protein B0F90DRAFT_1814455 [Multifurca ochricompacta]|uniref:Uncharacterized protein n=1 Tax=Multifurca ochricompacta TaxID=376703 RepID=A0AAD4MA38_9AGAM|nr:hypothetical protein B0F90DRAFT_1814455 [Multifurca ochricompacta]